MEKIKEWFGSTRNKIIAGVVAILVIGTSTVVYAITNNTMDPSPTITFKENIVIEYGQKIKEDEKTDKVDKHALPILKVEDLVDLKESTYDEISFEIIGDAQSFETKPTKLDASALGNKEATIFARLGEKVEVFSFKYEVKDTKAPLLDFVKDTEIKEGSEFKHEFKARDIVDGELPITIEGDYDVNKPGTYDLKATAVDKHNNKTEIPFTLTVKEKEVVVEEPTPEEDVAVQPTDDGWLPGTEGNGGSTDDSTGDGGTSIPDPEPVIPTCNYNIGNSGMLFDTEAEAIAWAESYYDIHYKEMERYIGWSTCDKWTIEIVYN